VYVKHQSLWSDYQPLLLLSTLTARPGTSQVVSSLEKHHCFQFSLETLKWFDILKMMHFLVSTLNIH
jgi:hypothetical protein